MFGHHKRHDFYFVDAKQKKYTKFSIYILKNVVFMYYSHKTPALGL